ncbi:MAG TPA: YSC84-related protein [Paraburkholderia sp.]|nr:YSC84-related protein [Paraburkholderia sp.]
MSRRQFLVDSGIVLALGSLALAGCKTGSSSATRAEQNIAKRQGIDRDVDVALAHLYAKVSGARELLEKASGILVFPGVIAAGFWFGAQYGNGALRVGGSTTAYYSTTGGSFGLQFGAQSKAVFLAFMNREALSSFVYSQGWVGGADATVAFATVGANGGVDSTTANKPVTGFVLTNGGLMAGVSLKGMRVSRLMI